MLRLDLFPGYINEGNSEGAFAPLKRQARGVAATAVSTASRFHLRR